MTTPRIVYIPGLLPKPEPDLHREALQRCLLHGLRNADADIADAFEQHDGVFEIVSWTYDFYGEHRDRALDASSIRRLLVHNAATPQDRQEATSVGRRFLRRLYLLGDWLPFLIPWLANERIETHIRDLNRYAFDHGGVAGSIREQLVRPLKAARAEGREVLLLAHSMGSVIAWDVLWELTHRDHEDYSLNTLITMGSPLGQTFIQKRIAGIGESGARRYPGNIRRWINFSAWGDLTATDPTLSNDFHGMLEAGLIDAIEDRRIYNWFRLDGTLNVHAEYGYLANREVGQCIAEFWRNNS